MIIYNNVITKEEAEKDLKFLNEIIQSFEKLKEKTKRTNTRRTIR